MEEETLKELSKKYCKRRKFILLLYKIGKTNQVNNIESYIEQFLQQSVSK